MGYSLDPRLPISEAVRRAALGEVKLAQQSLSGGDVHGGVHEARKCLKRLRSLLLLVRPGLPEPVFDNITERLRAIARGLAPARDAQALLTAVEKLGEDFQVDQDTTPAQSLRGWLKKRREAAERTLETSATAEALHDLAQLWPAFAGLRLHPDDFAPVADGLEESYRATRKAFCHALETDGDEDFHNWRKGVQRHWRHMQLLAPCWPSELGPRIEQARALSQILGDDHDIALLRQLVATPTMVFGSEEATEDFLKLCRKRHKRLRRQAEKRGKRLFAKKTRAFVKGVETHWSACATHSKAGAAAQPRIGNVVSLGDVRSGRTG